MNRKEFTLIELLVVIAVIAVLAGMLLPALGRAKATAHLITCLSNEKSIGTGVILYGESYNSYFPKEYTNARGQPLTSWMQQIYGAMQGDPKKYDPLTTGKSFWCPAVPVTAKVKENLKHYKDYGNSGVTPLAFNSSLLGSSPLLQITQSKTPSLCGVVADIERINSRSFNANGVEKLSYHRHMKKCNVYFLDGHANTVQTLHYLWPGAYPGKFSADTLSFSESSISSTYNWLSIYNDAKLKWLHRFYAERASDHDFFSSKNGNYR